MKKEKYLSHYNNFNVYGELIEKFTLNDLILYMYESYVNGQKKQSRELLRDILTIFDVDEIQIAINNLIEMVGIFETSRVLNKIGVNQILLENSIYDHNYDMFTEYQYVIKNAYDNNFSN